MVVAADEQLHGILPLAPGAGLAARPAAGGFELTYGHPLEITGLGEEHHRTLIGDQVDVGESTAEVKDLRATRDGVAIL